MARTLLLIAALMMLAPAPRAEARLPCWTLKLLGLSGDRPERHYAVGKKLGKGATATVYAGSLPPDFASSVEGAPAGWKAGTVVAVKVPNKPDAFRKASLREELANAKQIEGKDPKGLFLRVAWDAKREVLLSEYDAANMSLTDWLAGGGRLQELERAKVRSQLDEALVVLRSANMVHGDLNPNNILINPTTLAIKIIDLGIAAEPGKFPDSLQLKRPNGPPFRGGNEHYASPEQLRDEPARFADDEFTIFKVMQALK